MGPVGPSVSLMVSIGCVQVGSGWFRVLSLQNNAFVLGFWRQLLQRQVDMRNS